MGLLNRHCLWSLMFNMNVNTHLNSVSMVPGNHGIKELERKFLCLFPLKASAVLFTCALVSAEDGCYSLEGALVLWPLAQTM